MKRKLRPALAFAVTAMSLAMAAASHAQTYIYDDLGRLKKVTYPSGAASGYTYDAADNRTIAQTALNGVINTPPTCSNWYIYMSGVPTSIATASGSVIASAFTGQCTDVDGDTLTVTSPAMPLNFTLVPHEAKSYTYTVSDGKGGTASANFSVSRP